MSDLDFINRYKDIRNKFRPVPQVMHKTKMGIEVVDSISKKPIEITKHGDRRERLRRMLASNPPLRTYDRDIWYLTSDAPPVNVMEQARTIVLRGCEKWGYSPKDVRAEFRYGNLPDCRHEIYWHLRHDLGWSYPRIASYMGGKDHTTILHGCRKYQDKLDRGVEKRYA